jgi:hypothetical protein
VAPRAAQRPAAPSLCRRPYVSAMKVRNETSHIWTALRLGSCLRLSPLGVYRAVVQHGQVIEVYVSRRRDIASAQVLHGCPGCSR